MIKVLLIEDNKLALDYLKNLIEWEHYGFTVISTALDGSEGLKQYLKHKPQLIITDIKMPVMSGIEMSQQIRDMDKDVKIIFLSSYQEFDYARAALNAEASDYILKHELNEQSIVSKLWEIKPLIVESKIISRIKIEHELLEALGTVPSGRDLRKISYLKDDIYYHLFVIERDHPLEFIPNIKLGNKSKLGEQQVKRLLYDLGEKVISVIHIENDLYLVLVSLICTDKSAYDFAYEMKDILEMNFDGSFSVFIIGEDKKLTDLDKIFIHYKDVVNDRYFSKPSVVLNSIFLETTDNSGNVRFDESAFQHAIEKGDIDYILKFINIIFTNIIISHNYHGLLYISRKLADILSSYDGNIISLSGGKQFTMLNEHDGDRCYTAKGIAEFFREKYIELIDFINKNDYSDVVKSAIKYIFENYRDVNLSSQDISEHIGIGADRLGILFKKDTGYSVREYLNWYRIEKSKALIEKGLKICEIPKEVGYLTSQYFSKVFRKVTGFTPVEYKKKGE